MSRDAWISILKGAGIAALGAVLPYALQLLSVLPLGPLSPVVAAVGAIVVNAIRKWIGEQTAPATPAT